MGEMMEWRNHVFFLLMLVVLANAQTHFDDLSDLQGPYCETVGGCCTGRQDHCSAPILGTTCYCDDFCNNTRVHDCCPDYWSFCKGYERPTTPFVPTTTRRPIEELISCSLNGRNYFLNQAFKDNCNECKCELIGGRPEVVCERNVCIIDKDMEQTINSNPAYGFSATNYSEFWGRTLDDGVTYKLGTLQPQRFVKKMIATREKYDPNALPRSFDALQKWPQYIHDVQDQKWCGSSWAMSTVAVASDRYAIVSKGVENVLLSAQNLVSCDIRGQQSCKGGYLDKAWNFLKKFGLVDEDCFPYTGNLEKCTIRTHGTLQKANCRVRSQRTSRYSVGPAYRLGNETDIMHEIIVSGPVQATLLVYQDFFLYRGGVYKHTDLALNKRTGYHSVRIVGWGEEYTYNGLLEKYWKVANSWGKDWGEDGYFRIARGTNECEIESFVLGVWPSYARNVIWKNLDSQRRY